MGWARKGPEVSTESRSAGHELHKFASGLYPICRSITGQGVRQTLGLIGEHIPLSIREVPSGSSVYDWEVPLEWNIEDAWIKNALTLCWGDRFEIADFSIARQTADLAVVSLLLTTQSDPSTCEPAVIRSLLTDVWVRESGAWRLAVRHAAAPTLTARS